jgi:hypothetical protein
MHLYAEVGREHAWACSGSKGLCNNMLRLVGRGPDEMSPNETP